HQPRSHLRRGCRILGTCPRRGVVRPARGRRARPCRDAVPAALVRPYPAHAGGDGRGCRASPPNPGHSSCAGPTREPAGVDYTELLTVISRSMGGDCGGLKVDGGVVSHLATVAPAASALERQGYDGCWTAETTHDPFLPLVLAAEHTSQIELG